MTTPPPLAAPAPSLASAGALDPYVQEQANASMLRGGLYAAILGFVCAGLVCVLMLLGAKSLELPAAFAAICGLFCLGLYAAARRGLFRGWRSYAIILTFCSLPTTFFLLAHWMMPSGAATFVTGPISYLYMALVIVSGLMFSPRLCTIAGAFAGAQLFGVYLLARPVLASLEIEDPVLAQDLSAPHIWVVKAFMVFASGFFTAALAHASRRLISRVVEEALEKQSISRLFGQFVSPEVREKIMREKAETIGERKQVAVLFSDIRSFTTWSETTEPAVLVAQLNEYFDGMVSAITRNGGVVDKFIGDAVMAVFGGLIELPNPSDAALKAAKDMRQTLVELNAKWASEGRPALETGIGIHFGDVLQGTLGSVDRKEFTVIGDAVNTASRLEGATKDLNVAVALSASVFASLPEASRADCKPLGAVQLKGKAQSVEVYGLSR